MSTIKVPTSFNIEVEFSIPEFYRRLLALIIDMFIQFLYLRVIIAIYTNVTSVWDEDGTGIFLLLSVPIFIYHALLEILMNGQSFGKKIMGIRVVHENGGRASIDQFLIRWLLRLSDTWIVILLLMLVFSRLSLQDAESIFMVVFAFSFLLTDIVLVVSSPKSQRIGDLLARTILVRTKSRANIEETVFQDVADNYTPVFPTIMKLSDKDINAIKNILEVARKKGDYQMAESAADKIKYHLKLETNMPAFDFLDTLLKDYNYLSVK